MFPHDFFVFCNFNFFVPFSLSSLRTLLARRYLFVFCFLINLTFGSYFWFCDDFILVLTDFLDVNSSSIFKSLLLFFHALHKSWLFLLFCIYFFLFEYILISFLFVYMPNPYFEIMSNKFFMTSFEKYFLCSMF